MIIPTDHLGVLRSAFLFTCEISLGLAIFLSRLHNRFSWKVLGFPILIFSYTIFSFISLRALNNNNITLGIITAYTGVLLLAGLYLHYVMGIAPMTTLICSILAYSTQHLSIRMVDVVQAALGLNIWLIHWTILPLCYLLIYFLLARNITLDEDKVRDKKVWVFLYFFVAALAIALGPIIERLGHTDVLIFSFYDALCIILAMLIIGLVLNNDSLSIDLEHEKQVDALHRQQYELTKDTIDSINIAAHDFTANLKNFANSADESSSDLSARVRNETLTHLDDSITTYKSIYHTGNIALDTVLTQKSLSCARMNITLLCMADGSALDFMREEDIFTLFMNLLDNAIEAVKNLQPPERRVIDISVCSENEHTHIHVENYFDGRLKERGGEFQTTKQDAKHHGFGMRSMKRICQKYQGTLTTSHDDSIFCVDIHF
ncbi:ATP-binding protein [Alloscardovia omnicolens]|uniref:ATP-binding protein n=1 Tax=Alloscardovia omnicolens TaxID=419015 RepID=UPI003A5D6008